MPIYGEDSYENCLVELFSDVLGYSHVYGPNVERDYIHRCIILFWKNQFFV
jgi:hypothetical protein